MVSLFTRYGIRHNHIDFRQVPNYSDEILADEGVRQETRALIEGTDKADITEKYLRSGLRYFCVARKMMERYDCNAFTTPCKELCANLLPQKNRYIPCITHPLNKSDRIPSACEEDLTVRMTIVMMYLTRRSVFIGNPVLVPAGSRILEQLGIPRLLIQLGRAFDHDILGIHRVVPVCRTCGSDQPGREYGLTRFTTQGRGAHCYVNMVEEEGQVVTSGHFNRQGTKVTVAVGHTLGCGFRPVYCSPVVYYEVEGGAKELRQALTRDGYGHRQAIIYGNYVKELRELDETVGFEVEVFC